jgi:hypothetical protein
VGRRTKEGFGSERTMGLNVSEQYIADYSRRVRIALIERRAAAARRLSVIVVDTLHTIEAIVVVGVHVVCHMNKDSWLACARLMVVVVVVVVRTGGGVQSIQRHTP